VVVQVALVELVALVAMLLVLVLVVTVVAVVLHLVATRLQETLVIPHQDMAVVVAEAEVTV
jgi:hypothetical protein